MSKSHGLTAPRNETNNLTTESRTEGSGRLLFVGYGQGEHHLLESKPNSGTDPGVD